MAAEKLVPDEKILSDIFPGVVGLKPSSCNIISNTFDICTFSVLAEVILVIVRLETEKSETSKSRPATVAALSRLGYLQLNDIVPSIQQIGTATTIDTKVNYLVTEYLTGTVLLEDIWNTLDETNQLELVDSVVCAMDKLQKLGDIKNVYKYLTATPYISNDKTPVAIGGPGIGYFPDIKNFLEGILQKHKRPGCKLLGTDGGLSIQSEYDDIGQIDLSHSDLDELQHCVVFCHNDLEPRNILVRKSSYGKYKLAGVIDWEMAGFFPFAYEYGVKDTSLGRENLYFSWYTMFKRKASYLLPQMECHTKFIKAVRIIEKSKKKAMSRNVGVRVQEKWIQREKVEESSDIREGWIRKAGEKSQVFTKEDMQELENEVLKELGRI
ncbi:hypothetical protein N7489_003877 [Penicillium chrysogenum]|jgi:hypothetical protein|uniref:uncharacterized protein n=1 Tax=Penicillium chrysogenum TaxID=5076 RepID=UPI0024DF21D8|nr:uncharacterized protein N7489_003877 [Penicillium chrysogenum]KAJ5243781.1 hypothetical protein N7489_003877 [Penicillium chrysogenum]KAJ6140858.1 hypothetical protein N7497_011751 [Penicillium chrysogenum]